MEDEIMAIIRRMDMTGDFTVRYNEFEEFFRPLGLII